MPWSCSLNSESPSSCPLVQYVTQLTSPLHRGVFGSAVGFLEEGLQPSLATDFFNRFVLDRYVLLNKDLRSSLPGSSSTGFHTSILEFTTTGITTFVLSHAYYRPFGVSKPLACPGCGRLDSRGHASRGGPPHNPTSYTFRCQADGCTDRLWQVKKLGALMLVGDTWEGQDSVWYSLHSEWGSLPSLDLKAQLIAKSVCRAGSAATHSTRI